LKHSRGSDSAHERTIKLFKKGNIAGDSYDFMRFSVEPQIMDNQTGIPRGGS
jgi:hypothetical protein